MKYAMKLAAPLFLATLTTAQVAQAGSATGTMNVSGNVQGSCTVSAVALNFGAITPGSATDAEGSIGGACTTGTTYTITIDGGSSLVDTNRLLARGRSARRRRTTCLAQKNDGQRHSRRQCQRQRVGSATEGQSLTRHAARNL